MDRNFKKTRRPGRRRQISTEIRRKERRKEREITRMRERGTELKGREQNTSAVNVIAFSRTSIQFLSGNNI